MFYWNIFRVPDTQQEKGESISRELAGHFTNGTNIENNSTGSFPSSHALFSSTTEKLKISVSLLILYQSNGIQLTRLFSTFKLFIFQIRFMLQVDKTTEKPKEKWKNHWPVKSYLNWFYSWHLQRNIKLSRMTILMMGGRKTVRCKVQEYKLDCESEGVSWHPCLGNIYLWNRDTSCKIRQMDMTYSRTACKD